MTLEQKTSDETHHPDFVASVQYLQPVSFEIAKDLKELGFDWPCIAIYGERGKLQVELPFDPVNPSGETWRAPEQALVCKWLRDVHDLHLFTLIQIGTRAWKYKITVIDDFTVQSHWQYDSHETAEEGAIIQAIRILKEEANS